ncbi:OmpP1/FadL family transporter [Acidobacteriota bacterium]
MKNKIVVSTVILLSFFGLVSNAQASGFLIYEHGAAAMGMAGAFISLANDSSAVFYNPAGMAFLERTQFHLGATLIKPVSSLSLPSWPDPTYNTVKQESQIFYPPTFYITHRLNERISIGVGVFAPFGLGTRWPEDYPLKYIATRSDMKTFFINPSVAYRINDHLSFGVGLSYIRSRLTFNLVERVPVDLTVFGSTVVILDVPAALEAEGSAWALNLGFLYRKEKFSFGFTWRSGFNMKYKGDIDVNFSTAQLPSPFDLIVTFPLGGDAATEFSFPHIITVGSSFRLSEKWIFSADVNYTLWSSYDRFTVEVDIPGFHDKEVEEDWKNSFTFRGGCQYVASESLILRAGMLYDFTPQPIKTMDPILPDSNRFAITLGAGLRIGRFILDVAYQYEPFLDRTSPNRDIYLLPSINLGEGTYSTTAHLFGISLGILL